MRDYGLLAVFLVMLLKECGVPIPIPADLIMLGVALRSASGEMSVAGGIAALLIPMLLGGMLQYSIARGPGRRVVQRLAAIVGLSAQRLDTVMRRMSAGGSAAVAVGLTTPGVRIATNPASGLANLTPRRYLPGLALGSVFFLGWHYALGFAGGAALAALRPSTPVLIAIVAAFVLPGLVFALIKHRRKAREGGVAALASWAESGCPVCGALKLAQAEG